eukprot:GHVS01067652.1.p3 GENE.GHVS01067652.1~~GHVS01067652.1.p3  ORF type:complete len:130 (-),score=21.31 GHVS01067652.1:164-553(-)
MCLAAHNNKLNEMAQIKGKTEAQLREEIEETEEILQTKKDEREKIHTELRDMETEAIGGGKVSSPHVLTPLSTTSSQLQVSPDVAFLKEDLKNKDEEISILVGAPLILVERAVIPVERRYKSWRDWIRG